MSSATYKLVRRDGRCEILTEEPTYSDHGVNVNVRYVVYAENDKATGYKNEYRYERRFYPYSAFLYITTGSVEIWS